MSEFVKVYIEIEEIPKLMQMIGYEILPVEGIHLEEGCVYQSGAIEFHVIKV